VDVTPDRTVDGHALGDRSATALRGDPERLEETRRLLPPAGGSTALDRLAELAARLLGTDHSQISLLTDV
jgi:hypothetical protein